MVRVSFNLRWTAFVAPDKKRRCYSAERHRRCEEERLAGNNLFGLIDVRDNLFRRLIDAGTKTCESERCSHQFQERSSADIVMPFFGVLRVLALYELSKLRRVGQLFQIAPELFASILLRKDSVEHQSEVFVLVLTR